MSTDFKRPDGRKVYQLRPIRAKVGVIPNADGSAMFATGNTIAIAAVYGPKKMHPQHLPSNLSDSMIGAGVGYKRRQYVTHTTLPHHKSAMQTFILKQRIFIGALLLLVGS